MGCVNMHIYSRTVIAVLVSGLTLTGCAEDMTGGPGTSRLTVQLTDAPGDLKEAFVKIDKIIVQGASSSDTTSGRVELTPSSTGYIDLLTLTGGKVQDLVSTEIPAGNYSQLRFVIGGAYVRLKDDRVFATAGAVLPAGTTAAGELKCPSCAQSGFKVKFVDGGLVVGANSVVTVDFDAAQSFGHEAGNTGKWVMHPTLKASGKSVAVGTISGNVTLATGITVPTCGGAANTLAAFKPLAVAGADTLTGTTEATGAFKVSNVFANTYTLSSIDKLSFTNGDSLMFVSAATPPTVIVASGATATANYQITAATCKPKV
jgi:hypothetical protein